MSDDTSTELDCVCNTWARSDQKMVTKHHKACHLYDPEGDAMEIIEALIEGIDYWASDEDGVHYKCWDAYVAAMISVGRKPPNIDGEYS